MNFLQIAQSLHYEAKLPGDPPDAVTGQTGRKADLVRWAASAWNDIQRTHDGKWKWLLRDFYVDTVADTQSYAYGDCTDTLAAATITRWRKWLIDRRYKPYLYLVSTGESDEGEIEIMPWPRFRYDYIRNTHTSSRPGFITEEPHTGALWLGPTPEDVYRLSGQYWRSNQTLAADGDEPEMPSDYHDLIVYQALTKYGFAIVAQEILARAEFEGRRIMNNLEEDQLWSRASISIGDTLA